MKIFISWSGPLSKVVAEKLRTWLRRIIPVVEPFVSTEDIQKGDGWLSTVLKKLEESDIGIVCITRENLHSDWLLFESGAIAKHMGKSKVCTLLVDVSPIEVDAPLSCFQATTLKKEVVLRLLKNIHSTLQPPLLSDQELEEQFSTWWPELESHIRKALMSPFPPRTEIQQLTEELLLPVIYREACAGDLDTVFHWLQIAKRRHVADLEGRLGFVEACLARITGKRGAEQSLRQLSAKVGEPACVAYVEWLFIQFAADRRLGDLQLDLNLLEASPVATRRTAYALIGLWHLREGRQDQVKLCLEKAAPDAVSRNAHDHYRAISVGMLCFALEAKSLGEKHFDLIKNQEAIPTEGYPFVSLVGEFDRSFVTSCIGRSDRPLTDMRIRELRGHAWVMAHFADVLRHSIPALQTLAKLGAEWRPPLHEQGIADRLRQFQHDFPQVVEQSSGKCQVLVHVSISSDSLSTDRRDDGVRPKLPLNEFLFHAMDAHRVRTAACNHEAKDLAKSEPQDSFVQRGNSIASTKGCTVA